MLLTYVPKAKQREQAAPTKPFAVILITCQSTGEGVPVPPSCAASRPLPFSPSFMPPLIFHSLQRKLQMSTATLSH